MSDFQIVVNTNPIPASVLVPKPYTYPSGGTSAGGVTKAEMDASLAAFGAATQPGIVAAFADSDALTKTGLQDVVTNDLKPDLTVLNQLLLDKLDAVIQKLTDVADQLDGVITAQNINSVAVAMGSDIAAMKTSLDLVVTSIQHIETSSGVTANKCMLMQVDVHNIALKP